jgi:hypothetical protein
VTTATADAPTVDRSLPPLLVVVGVLLSGTSIAALLAEVYGVVDMAAVGRFVTLPGLIGLAVLGSGNVVKGPAGEELRRRLRVGAVGGVIGTLGYDVFRIPFAVAGRRLFAPIDSYGMFLVDADLSSSVSDTVGWLFHLSNGVTFGTAYALVMARRHWGWGVLWGLILESAIVLTPFRERYHLHDWTAIGIAYAAHIPYGYAVGWMAQRADEQDHNLRTALRRPVLASVGLAAAVIVAWQHPWSDSAERELAHRLSADEDRTVVVVRGDTMVPEWSRVRVGECLLIENVGDDRFETQFGVIEPDARSELCFDGDGVFRVRLGDRPYSGGFVDVED